MLKEDLNLLGLSAEDDLIGDDLYIGRHEAKPLLPRLIKEPNLHTISNERKSSQTKEGGEDDEEGEEGP